MDTSLAHTLTLGSVSGVPGVFDCAGASGSLNCSKTVEAWQEVPGELRS